MNENKRAAFFVAGVMLIMLIAGCQTETNTNANGNTAVVTTNANVKANTNANANANAGTTNANITREEYEKNKERFMEEAKKLGRQIGTGAEDGWLWTKTRAALATTDDLPASTINVDVNNAAVTRSGTG